jgi:hypothetical protein
MMTSFLNVTPLPLHGAIVEELWCVRVVGDVFFFVIG